MNPRYVTVHMYSVSLSVCVCACDMLYLLKYTAQDESRVYFHANEVAVF